MNARAHLVLAAVATSGIVAVGFLGIQMLPQIERNSQEATRRVIQHQIRVYAAEHGERHPIIYRNTLPQLILATNVEGRVGPAGPGHPYGPYFEGELPVNPIDGSNLVTAVPHPGSKPRTASGPRSGWLYDEVTGKIYPNSPQYYQRAPSRSRP